ncbi:FAD-binding oxidoreductase [Ruegeria sp. 2012CJ41-6]|uniref:FAD-binding oxidoreductase n=1 Tax=Ruegeria spongiae TaxID=2942209 RepID=A0ABT0QB57_9RHOB|nr:FAD-dependent oxidoreductase [Ruegeria spongiae]MCL6286129.1 FAD-binding oxidoreductase [Ruegeria spongiae]
MFDFVIIGGGVAGLGAGACLSEQGSVLLLEAESALGYHASGRSAAMFEPNYGAAPIVSLNRASESYHRSENGGYLTPRGLMLVAGADQKARFDADVEDLSLHPIPVEQAVERVPILNPQVLGFAAHHDTAEDIDTDRLLQDFAKRIRANGGRIVTGAQVTGIEGSGPWRVTAGEVHEARMLVNAAGAWADRIATLAGVDPIGLVPHRRSMARIPAPGGRDVRGWPMLMGVGESWYAKPDAGKLIVSPADAEPVEPHDAYADDMVLAEGIARYQEMVTEEVTRVESNWAGLRCFVSDRVLVLGPDPDVPDFIWCAGQGGYGFQTAPAASRLLADLMSGAPPELEPEMVAALSPGRLRR